MHIPFIGTVKFKFLLHFPGDHDYYYYYLKDYHFCVSCDNMFYLVSSTVLCILADLSNAEVWMVTTHPPISNSSSPFNNHLAIDPSAPFTIGITVSFLFRNLFRSLIMFKNFSLFSSSLIFIMWSGGTAKSSKWQVPFLLAFTRSGFLSVSQYPRLLFTY